MPMRIATWNVNGLRARLDLVLHWLRARRPDIVGLQELKLVDEQFPYAELKAEGYHAVVHPQASWNGVAVLSRDLPAVRQKGLPGQDGQGARLISATIGDLTFVTLYTPNGKQVDHPDFLRKLDWLDSLPRYLGQYHGPNEALILCGDFNLCPGPLDTWNEEALRGQIFHTEAERTRFRTLLDWGFVDLYREFTPTGQAFSWWDYRAGAFHKNQGLRIDLLLATRSIWERVRHVEIDREYRKKQDGLTASDHAPVLADLI